MGLSDPLQYVPGRLSFRRLVDRRLAGRHHLAGRLFVDRRLAGYRPLVGCRRLVDRRLADDRPLVGRRPGFWFVRFAYPEFAIA